MSIPVITYPYNEFLDIQSIPEVFIMGDHLNGFLQNGHNPLLQALSQFACKNKRKYTILMDQYILPEFMHDRYQNLDIKFSTKVFQQYNPCTTLSGYRQHPAPTHNKFLCTFNGSSGVGRMFLLALLNKFGWFDPATCSKNIRYDQSQLDGSLESFVGKDKNSYYRKFFITPNDDDFADTVFSFGYNKFDHANNISVLSAPLAESFVHLVSECQSVYEYPYITEKFLYSVVNRGLFVTYGQVGWHQHLTKYWGFKPYTKIFDYHFDDIRNPVERLLALVTMLSKFRHLSRLDYHDLHEMEHETTEYNYDHYFSGAYLKSLARFDTCNIELNATTT